MAHLVVYSQRTGLAAQERHLATNFVAFWRGRWARADQFALCTEPNADCGLRYVGYECRASQRGSSRPTLPRSGRFAVLKAHGRVGTPSVIMLRTRVGRPPADARARRHNHHFHPLLLHTLSACPRPACPRRSGRELSSASIGGKTAAREGILVHV